MTKKTRKSDSDKAAPATEASAVELEESNLDEAVGGSAYLKLGDIRGESYHKMEVIELKLGDSTTLASSTLKR